MKMIIEADAKEIAALVRSLQERRIETKLDIVREPYQRHYSVVEVGVGQESSLEDK